jgi:3-dehydroquinate synthase
MSDLKANVIKTKGGFHVEGYEKITYDFSFIDGVFNVANPQLANCYSAWGRVLAIMDKNVYGLYGQEIDKYFRHYNLPLTVHKTRIGEKAKTVDTWLSICTSMTDFGIIRKVRHATASCSSKSEFV